MANPGVAIRNALALGTAHAQTQREMTRLVSGPSGAMPAGVGGPN
jgi:hypothetical protein